MTFPSRKPRVAVDICNTIADVNDRLKVFLGERPDPESYDYPGATPEFFKEHAVEIFGGAPPLPGALEGVRLLAVNHEIIYLTARPEWARDITRKWLEYWGFPEGRLVMTGNKAEAALELGVLIALDDAPHEIRALQNVVPAVLVKRQPYNRGLGLRFDWDGLLPVLKAVYTNVEVNRIDVERAYHGAGEHYQPVRGSK